LSYPAAVSTIAAILFDLDGTLVDNEGSTDDAIALVLSRHGVKGALPPTETRGRTWGDIVSALRSRHTFDVDAATLERELVEAWGAAMSSMLPTPGAPDAVRAAAAHFPVAVVSSSPRALVERLLEHIGVRAVITAIVGAGEAAKPKPDAACFQLGASRLGVDGAACLVFEDSSAGLLAARAAGMASVVVLCRCAEVARCQEMATARCADLASLPAGFWRALREDGSAALAALR
jgi:beta-phosphoglucomutase-like phosphatase (HAD superfamily)